MYFPILGAYLITASCKHDIIDKANFSFTEFWPREINRSSWFSFFYKKCLLLFSYLCPTMHLMDHQKICILLFFVRNFLVSPQNHHHQDTFCLLYLYISYKTNPRGERNVGIFFVRIKEITSLYPLQRVTSWKNISDGPNIILPCKCFNIWALLPKSDFSLHHKTQCPLHLYIYPLL